jgi:hypothetical protein
MLTGQSTTQSPNFRTQSDTITQKAIFYDFYPASAGQAGQMGRRTDYLRTFPGQMDASLLAEVRQTGHH